MLLKLLRLSARLIAANFLILLFATTPVAADMDGVMMSNGKMMMMKAGEPATTMEHEVKMSDGTIVSVDGVVKSRDGKKYHLQNGEMIMMDGNLMKGGKAASMER